MDKHKVLVFGNKTFGKHIPIIKSDVFDVTFQRFPEEWDNHKRASNYSIIILDYCAFKSNGSVYREAQEIFEKELIEALGKGSTVCFLHYNEDEPESDNYNSADGYMNRKSIEEHLVYQLGFRFLHSFSIRPQQLNSLIHNQKLIRTEFKNFFDKWGTSKNIFIPYGDGNFDDIICYVPGIRDNAVAFSNDFKQGFIIYLPCQRNFSNMAEIIGLFKTLIDNLITYITRKRTELPDYAKEPFFEEEASLCADLHKAKEMVKNIEGNLEPYYIAKVLAFASEYELQKLVPKFLSDEFKISTLQNETYNEDFWLLDSDNNKIAVCEVKSYVKGFSKSGVYDIYNHREFHKLDETFPAILFVNVNLNAAGWKQKLSPIAPQDYQAATSNNVLVVRIEDLLFMWDTFKKNKITKVEIIKTLTINKGWLYFKPDHTFEIKQ
jgi:hypothetical protein